MKHKYFLLQTRNPKDGIFAMSEEYYYIQPENKYFVVGEMKGITNKEFIYHHLLDLRYIQVNISESLHSQKKGFYFDFTKKEGLEKKIISGEVYVIKAVGKSIVTNEEISESEVYIVSKKDKLRIKKNKIVLNNKELGDPLELLLNLSGCFFHKNKISKVGYARINVNALRPERKISKIKTRKKDIIFEQPRIMHSDRDLFVLYEQD